MHQFHDRCSAIWPSLRDTGGGNRDAYNKSGLERFGYRGALLSTWGANKSAYKEVTAIELMEYLAYKKAEEIYGREAVK